MTNERPDSRLPFGTRHLAFGVSRGLGLIELLTIVAILVVGLAFVVSMARHVRSTSANELTRKRMGALVDATRKLSESGVDPALPMPAGLLEGRPHAASVAEDRAAVEAVLRQFARDSSRHLADELAAAVPASPLPALPALPAAIGNVTSGLPEMNDAWGQPIALMPGQHPDIGMAPDDGPFLVSAGPDGKFLTLTDNLYSYDLPALLPRGRGQGQGARGKEENAAPTTTSAAISSP